jgi:hypothetical protein
MAIRGGRGDENKTQIRLEWELVPILHTRLLNGQEITCCCGDKVTTTYYRFDAKNRSNGKQDVLFAADGCARKLLGIVPAIAPLPLFDPLQATPVRHNRGAGGGDPNGPVMHPFNREVYEAIHLLLMCWGRPPSAGGPLAAILADIRQAPGISLPDSAAKSVNSVIKSGQRTLTAMLQALPSQTPPLRAFGFPLMRIALRDHKDRPTIWL